ncbi:MAG: glycosyltransferase [Acidimicrobiales bacterium]
MPIARQLARRGHDVSFVCPVDFEPMFAAEPSRVIGSTLLPSPSILDRHAAFVARWGTRVGGLFLPRLYFDRIVLPHLDELYDEADTMCARADIVVSHPWSHLIVGPAAERRGVPTVVGDVFPMLVPSASMPPPGHRSLGRLGNQAAWSVLHAPSVNRAWFMGAFRRLRQRLGLPVEGWSLFGARLSPTQNLGMFSRHYQPRLPDWPDNYHVIGFCPWAPDDATLPPGCRPRG